MLKHGVRILWIALSLSILIVALIKFDGTPNSDVDDFQGIAMLILTFPSGYIVIALLSIIGVLADTLFSKTIQTSYLELLVTWMLFLVAGYLQWFKVLPYLFQRRKRGERSENK